MTAILRICWITTTKNPLSKMSATTQRKSDFWNVTLVFESSIQESWFSRKQRQIYRPVDERTPESKRKVHSCKMGICRKSSSINKICYLSPYIESLEKKKCWLDNMTKAKYRWQQHITVLDVYVVISDKQEYWRSILQPIRYHDHFMNRHVDN